MVTPQAGYGDHAGGDGRPGDGALGLAAAAIAWARVAAHVHHLQDVLAGLALGALAAVIASLTIPSLISRLMGAPPRGRNRAAVGRDDASGAAAGPGG